MTVIQAVLLGVAGLGAGVLAGLVGVGGGVVFTPTLFAVYGVLDVPAGVRTPLTVGTGLFCTGLVAWCSCRPTIDGFISRCIAPWAPPAPPSS